MKQPKCYCLISFCSSFHLFSQILDQVERKFESDGGNQQVFTFLHSVLAQPFPNPGESLEVNTFKLTKDEHGGEAFVTETVQLDRIDKDYHILEYVNYKPLFEHLDIETILLLFKCVLLEYKILIISESISVLSQCADAIYNLCYPFSWQHIFIPILPSSMSSVLAAPIPFIIGILRSYEEKLQQESIEDDALIIDMDKGQVLNYVDINPSFMSDIDLDYMIRTFGHIKEENFRAERFNSIVSTVLVKFFSDIYGDYTEAFEINNGSSRIIMDKVSKGKPYNIRRFILDYQKTQQFVNFIHERLQWFKKGLIQHCDLYLASKKDLKQVILCKIRAGLCGLRNLGGTSYLNSLLQCFSNTKEIKEFFVNTEYDKYINKLNPVGMNGEIAKKFGNVLRDMWSGLYVCVSPLFLLKALEKWCQLYQPNNPSSNGYLLMFLLDSLHEEINSVEEKIYLEHVDASDFTDEEASDLYWNLHMSRNQSLFFDLFHGQIQVTNRCTVCKTTSRTFETINHFTLPIIHNQDKIIEVVYIHNLNHPEPAKKCFKVSKSDTVITLKRIIAKKYNVNVFDLIVTTVHNHQIHLILDNQVNILKTIAESVTLHIYNMENPKKAKANYLFSVFHRSQERCFGIPYLLSLPKMTGYGLYSLIWNQVRHFIDSNEKEPNVKSPVMHMKALPFKLFLHLVNKDGQSNQEVFITCDDYTHVRVPSHQIILLSITWEPNALKCIFDRARFEKMFIDNTLELSLDECLRANLKERKTKSNQMWYCNTCKEHQRCFKKIDIWRLPKVIIFHLIFKIDSKYRIAIQYPGKGLTLDHLIKYKSHIGRTFDLYSFIVKDVKNHFSAYARFENANDWRLFDDMKVTLQKDKELSHLQVDTLFYALRE